MHTLEYIKKHRSVISYVFFGVCTTLINLATYYLCYNIWRIENVLSTVIAWVVAVLFAFITNKRYVFGSKSFEKRVFAKEILFFFTLRILSGIFEVGLMYFTVTLLSLNSTLCKLTTNVIVIILNYIASKIVIFKNKSR